MWRKRRARVNCRTWGPEALLLRARACCRAIAGMSAVCFADRIEISRIASPRWRLNGAACCLGIGNPFLPAEFTYDFSAERPGCEAAAENRLADIAVQIKTWRVPSSSSALRAGTIPFRPDNNYKPQFDLCQGTQQSWALSVFLNLFNNKKLFFAFFIKLIWLGVGFLKRTGAKIGS